ncbi:MAG: ABC transporter permease, partial [Planctomycetota bacterium]
MKFKYKLIKALHICGIGVFEPVVHLVTGEEPAKQIPRIGKFIVVPIVGVVAFMFAWHFAAAGLKTSYGDFPGPSQVWAAVGDLREEARVDAEKRVAFAEKKA